MVRRVIYPGQAVGYHLLGQRIDAVEALGCPLFLLKTVSVRVGRLAVSVREDFDANPANVITLVLPRTGLPPTRADPLLP